MRTIIGGVILIIAGLSGMFVLRGTGSSAALAVVGVIVVIIGIIQMNRNSLNKPGARKDGEDMCTVITEQLHVYKAPDLAIGLSTILSVGTTFLIDFSMDWGEFYQIRFNNNSEIGYIIKTSKILRNKPE